MFKSCEEKEFWVRELKKSRIGESNPKIFDSFGRKPKVLYLRVPFKEKE
jgi:hypothetical protein